MEPVADVPASEPVPPEARRPDADAPGAPEASGGDTPASDTLFEVPDGFWDEPADLSPDEAGRPDEARLPEAAAEPAAAPGQGQAPLADEAEPDSGLALLQKVFPGRIISQQPLLVAGVPEEPGVAADGDGLPPEQDTPPD